ncbi:hypothetical protein Tco_0687575 [Tanacetum coccineum]
MTKKTGLPEERTDTIPGVPVRMQTDGKNESNSSPADVRQANMFYGLYLTPVLNRTTQTSGFQEPDCSEVLNSSLSMGPISASEFQHCTDNRSGLDGECIMVNSKKFWSSLISATAREFHKNNQYILATQVTQVFYLQDLARQPRGWKVVEHVYHRDVAESDPDVIHGAGIASSSNDPAQRSFYNLVMNPQMTDYRDLGTNWLEINSTCKQLTMAHHGGGGKRWRRQRRYNLRDDIDVPKYTQMSYQSVKV